MPTIVDRKIPDGFQSDAVEPLKEYVNQHWRVELNRFTLAPLRCHIYRSHVKLEEHLWILIQLLKTSSGQYALLLNYVVATCVEKMLCRLTLSKPYFTSLNRVETFEFPEDDTEEGTEREVRQDLVFFSNIFLPLVPKLSTKLPKL